MTLGELINQYRTSNKMSMQEFADAAGLSKGYISMLEKNKHPQSKRKLIPSLETYEKVASAMNISLDELIIDVDSNEKIRVNCTYVEMSDVENDLIMTYRKLNKEGQERLSDYADDLVSSGKYIKNDKDKLVEKA